MKKLRCSEDLGIADCDLVVEGETPGEIVEQIVPHLRKEHDIDMPNVDAIMDEDVDREDLDDKTWTVVKRMREALETDDFDAEDEELPGEEHPSMAPKK
mgnify:CR=1 FL=1